MLCPSCGTQVLPYLQRCDHCGAVVQSYAEASRKEQEWERLPEYARQELSNKIKEARAKSIHSRGIRTRHFYEYLFLYGLFVSVLTFLGDLIARGGFRNGLLCALVGGLCGMAGCAVIYRLRGRLATGFLVMPAAYVLSDFLKPGNSYILELLKLISSPAIISFGVSPGESSGYARAGYAIILVCSIVVFTIIGGIVGEDIKKRIAQEEM